MAYKLLSFTLAEQIPCSSGLTLTKFVQPCIMIPGKMIYFFAYNFDLALATSSRRRIFPEADLGIESTKLTLCNLLNGATCLAT